MNKISILGVTASGKTTLANKIGKTLGIPVTHLDKIFWKEKGGIKQDVFIAELEEVMKAGRWIIDGGMPRSKTLQMRLENADTIILYDLPLLLVLWRQTKRFFKYYGKVRPDMADGNHNKQKYPFTWKEIQYARHFPIKELYEKILPLKETKRIVIIKSPKDEKTFLKTLK